MDQQFYVSQMVLVPVHSAKKGRSRNNSNDLTIEEKRNQIVEMLEQNAKEWSSSASRLNFAMFFSLRSKEIRIKELLHIHYILNRTSNSEISTNSAEVNQLSLFATKHFKAVRLISKKADPLVLEYSLRKVKKIYPYTSPSRTVLNIKENCFLNMACPITQQVACRQYSLRKMRHQESLNVRQYEEDELLEGGDSKHESAFRQYISEI